MMKQEYDGWVQQHDYIHASLDVLEVDECFEEHEDYLEEEI